MSGGIILLRAQCHALNYSAAAARTRDHNERRQLTSRHRQSAAVCAATLCLTRQVAAGAAGTPRAVTLPLVVAMQRLPLRVDVQDKRETSCRRYLPVRIEQYVALRRHAQPPRPVEWSDSSLTRHVDR